MPLSRAKVEEFLEQYKHTEDGVQWWQPNEDYTTLTRCFYLNNIFCAVEFVKDIYEMDADTTQQIPNISILHQDIVKIELHSRPLKGLSTRDFELAIIIDSFDFKKYELWPLEKEQGYRSYIRRKKLDIQNESVVDEIAASAGGSRFGNKFKSTVYDQNFKSS